MESSEKSNRPPEEGHREPDTEPHIVFYSRTGTTQQVASDIASHVETASIHRIRPRSERSYPNWLARSFVPGSTVAIESMKTEFQNTSPILLGTPKWSLSCPPVTAFIERATLEGTPVGLFLTYGGFDEQRYADELVDRLRKDGANVRSTLLIQRDDVGDEAYRKRVRGFCTQVLDMTPN